MKKGIYYQRPVIIGGIIFAVLIVASVLFSVFGGEDGISLGSAGKKAKSEVSDFNSDAYPKTSGSTSSQSNKKIKLERHTGVIVAMAEDYGTMTIRETGTGAEITGTFSGATNIKTAYDKTITAPMLRKGDFVDIDIDKDGNLRSVLGSKDAWTYKGIFNMTIDPALKKITVSDAIYRYDDSLLILIGDEFADMSQINSLDVFDVCGLDNYIYLIKVASGHGWLQLVNDEAFVGGTLTVDGEKHENIETATLYELSEGRHSIEITNGTLKVSDTVQIGSQETTPYDLQPYTPEPEKFCMVTFKIEPYGALLRVDGGLTAYEDPVPLSYGTHEISVFTDNYKTYNGTLTTETESTVFSIALSYQPPVPTAADNTDGTDSSRTGTGNNTDTWNAEEYNAAINGTGSTTGTENVGGGTTGTGNTGTTAGNDGSDTNSAGTAAGNNGTDVGNAGTTAGDVTDADYTDDETDTDDMGADDDDEEIDDGSAPVTAVLVSATDSYLAVTGTEGCAVFVQNMYKGVIQNGTLVIAKPLGTVEIRLTLEGYITQRQTVSFGDDGENKVVEFDEMEPRE